jgi:hypothetical protein
LQNPPSVCLHIADWNEALFWLTIEGSEGKIDAQIWVSTFGLPQSRVEQLTEEWGGR